MRDNPLTSDIIIETLKRSSLKTILVEGTDDFEIYRKVERKIGLRNADFLPCDGKNTLIKVFEKIDDIDKSKIMFVADRDSWVFSHVPENYKEIYFTKGYCIENDLFEDGCELVFGLLDSNEVNVFQELVTNVSKWFAFEITLINGLASNNHFSDITLLSTNVMESNTNNFTNSFLSERNYFEPEASIIEDIQKNYMLKLRGKFIFQLLERIFQNRKEKKALKYHRRQLFDLCFVEGVRDKNKPSNMNRMIKEIEIFLK